MKPILAYWEIFNQWKAETMGVAWGRTDSVLAPSIHLFLHVYIHTTLIGQDIKDTEMKSLAIYLTSCVWALPSAIKMKILATSL